MVEYLNTLPMTAAFTQRILQPSIQFVFDVPTQLNRRLRHGELDISLISSVEYLDNKESYCLLPNFGIAASKKILSVNLYVRDSIQTLDGALIGVTNQSASSIALLKVLCKHFWNIVPQFEFLSHSEETRGYEGILLIGNEALKNSTLSGFHTIDLAQEWYNATQHPFVFALFAFRPELSLNHHQELLEFEHYLDASLQWAEQHLTQLEEIASVQCDLKKNLFLEYYRLFTYRLKEKEMLGLKLFEELRK